MISYLDNLKDKQNEEEILKGNQARKRLEIPPDPVTPVKVKKIEIIGNESDLIDNNGKLNNLFSPLCKISQVSFPYKFCLYFRLLRQ